MKDLQQPCITARVYGGLGNQCFIYSTARALADRCGARLMLDPSMLALDTVYRRPYLLSQFSIRVDGMAAGASLEMLRLRRLHTHLRRTLGWRADRWLFETVPPRFLPDVVTWRGKTGTLDGYWQDERYFLDDAFALFDDLMPMDVPSLARTPLALQINDSEHSVAIHVRSYREVPGRQDGSFALPMSYFQNAIAWIRSVAPGAHFFLFSDDPQWVSERLVVPPGTHWTVVDHADSGCASPMLDFYLMTLCRHAIVANSSFSWWGAWLGEQHRRRSSAVESCIVCPAAPTANPDFYPARWLRV